MRVLFFEDCGEDIELALRRLRSEGFDVKWDVAATTDEVLERVQRASYDVILSDYRMPGTTGMDLFELLKTKGVATPFILVTGSLGEEMAVACLKRGVADFVLKDHLARLPMAVRRARDEERLRLDREQAEQALRASEASYRSLIESAPCGILRLSAGDGHLLDANKSLAGMLGYGSVAELLQASSGDGLALDTGTLARLTRSGSQPGQVVESDVCWARKDGELQSIRLAGRLLQNEDGSPACLEMTAENVTERRLAQHRIRQLNGLNSVLIHSGQAIVRTRDSVALVQEICRIIVEEGGFQMAWLGMVDDPSQRVTPLASYPRGDLYLNGIRASAADEPAGRGPIGRAIRHNRLVVCNRLAADSSMVPCRDWAVQRSFQSVAAFPIVMGGRPAGAMAIYAGDADFFDDEKVALLDGLAADLSFALDSLEAARLHERISAELDQFFALSLDMLCICNLQGQMLRFNPAWEQTLGFSAEELRSKPWYEFVHPDDRKLALDVISEFRAGNPVNRLEMRFLSKDGSYKWLVGSAAPSLDHGVVFAAVSDITDRKQLEGRLRSQNLELEERNRQIEAANRMKTEFLANMSHELRSPLNGIIGFTELLYDGKLGNIPERPREFLARIHASASHLLQLLNGVLDLSKIEAGHSALSPEPLLVSNIIQEVTGILSAEAAKKQIIIRTEIEPEVNEVIVDAARLRQVLFNYLSNAIKFTGEGGRVTVRLKAGGAADFRLEVSDTGIGIAQVDLSRLFVEFQQLDASAAKRYQGTGLGLALTKHIVEAQGGSVGVHSRLGEGSTFFAVLPRTPHRLPEPAMAPEGVIHA